MSTSGVDPFKPAAPTPRAPLHEQVPLEPLASPVHLRGQGADVRWWKPTWRDAWRYLGWRWVLFLPAAGVLCLFVAMVLEPGMGRLIWFLGPKLLIMILCLPFIAAGYALKRGVQARSEPFCIHCGYELSGLPDHYLCPECGLPYDFQAIEEYRRDPDWFIQRYKAQHKTAVEQTPFDAGPAQPGRPRRRSRDGT
jgi:hypothetical protein